MRNGSKPDGRDAKRGSGRSLRAGSGNAGCARNPWYNVCFEDSQSMYSGPDDLLFYKADVHAVETHQRHAVETEIAEMDGNRLLNTNIDDLVNYIADKYRIDVPVLDEANMTVDQQESKRDVAGDPRRIAFHMGESRPVYVTGTEVVVEVPFTGDAELFSVKPNPYSLSPPRGHVHGNTISFRYWSDRPEAKQVRSAIDQWLAEVKESLNRQQENFKGFNNELPRLARARINQRRDKLLANQNMVAGLGIPLKQRPGTASTYIAPEVRRKIALKPPPASPGTFKPEPILEEAEYAHILDVIESMAKVMERTPKAFHDIDEEGLRTHFLVQLNGHYEGQATGETFNYQGKTDILIRSDDRNTFIAECKFWGGPAKLTETIDQLLGYLSWRDSKAAILLFNRNKDFSKVLAAIPETVAKHSNLQKDEGKRGESGFRYAFRHKDDPAKIIHVTILAFDIPQRSE
jgi:hypothetical protein